MLLRPWASAVLITALEACTTLFGPVDATLAELGTDVLLVYLSGSLRYLPLSALHDGEQYVAEKWSLVWYTPAAKDKLDDEPSGSRRECGRSRARFITNKKRRAGAGEPGPRGGAGQAWSFLCADRQGSFRGR